MQVTLFLCQPLLMKGEKEEEKEREVGEEGRGGEIM